MNLLHLQLSPEQQNALTEYAGQFNRELEDKTTPPFPQAATLSALKEELKAALFAQDGVADVWEAALTEAALLCLGHERTDIRNLPWQTATEERPLLAIAKTYKKELPKHRPSVGYPLKVLVMVASPEGVTRLAYEEEELQLLRAFSPLMAQGLVQVHFTDDGSLDNLEERLEENKYHILHFTGHGRYEDGKGTLALEDPLTGKVKEATAVEFNQVLAKVGQKGHRPDLVVLSACQTAQGVETGDLSGVADTLMRGGIPAVVAMAASILDNCATLFAAHLYAELSAGYPLAAAFQQARLAVRDFEIETYTPAKYGLAPGQWLIPQLLLNADVTDLVDKNSPRDALDFKNDVKLIRGERALLELRVRPANYVFIGRRREKRTALRQLKDGNSILLRGQGGVGKTALAEHLAIRLLAGNQRIKVFTFSEKAPTAQSLLDQLQNYLTKEKRYFAVVTELNQIPAQTDKFFHLLGKVSSYCDPVFLFDNIETFQRYDEETRAWVWKRDQHEDVLQLLAILHQNTPFPLIITGRYPLTEFPELAICNMNTVPFGDFFRKCHQLQFRDLAQELRSSPLKKTDGDRPPTFEEIARLLHRAFGGNYRALEFFDELYVKKGKEITDTLGKLADFETRLADKDIQEGVLARISENLVFEELLGYLNEREKDTLLVLARFNIPVLPMAIGMQRGAEDRSEDLSKLVDLTLVERQPSVDGRERYYVIPLVRDLLGEMEVTFDEKVAGDYHDYVVKNDLSEDGLSELTEAFERYFSAKAVEEINEVGGRLCRFYYHIQQFRLSLVFGLRTEQIAGDKTAGYILSIIGTIFQVFGDLESALKYKELALEDYRTRGDRQGEGTLLNNISQIYDAKGDYDTALGWLQQSLHIQREIGDRRGEGATLNNIGQIHQARSDYDTALGWLQQSLHIVREIGDRKGEGATLSNLAAIAHAKGDYDTALGWLQQSLHIRREIGDRKGEGATLNNISQIYDAKGDYDTALGWLQQSLHIRREIGDRQGEGATLSNISQIYSAKGDYDTALGWLQQSLHIQREIGDRQGEGATLNNIGQIHQARGDYDTALGRLQQSLHIQREIGDRKGEGTTLNNISQIYDAKGDYDTALGWLQQSLHIRREIGDRKGEGATLNNLATTAHAKGDYDTALGFLQQSLHIQREIGDRRGESTTIGNIASIYKIKGDLAKALDYYHQDLSICQSIGDIPGMAITLHNIGSMFFSQEKMEEAIPYLMPAYQIFDKIGSPSKQATERYLNAIIQQIGQARFTEIIHQLNQNQ